VFIDSKKRCIRDGSRGGAIVPGGSSQLPLSRPFVMRTGPKQGCNTRHVLLQQNHSEVCQQQPGCVA